MKQKSLIILVAIAAAFNWRAEAQPCITNVYETATGTNLGSLAPTTNIIDVGWNTGTLIINYDFLGIPNNLSVYWDGERKFFARNKDSGTYTIPFTSLSNVVLTIIMHEDDPIPDASGWSYTPTITIYDSVAPTITCPPDVIVSANSGCAATNVALGIPGTSDNGLVVSVTNNAPASFPLGTNVVTWMVTDDCGNTNSCTQRVIVYCVLPPTITAQPQNQTVAVGNNATFFVAVSGSPPFVFQWYFNGTHIGSTSSETNYSSYTLTDVGTNQVGNYSVQVVNGYGSMMSSNAVLTVIPPPSLTLWLSAGYPLLNLYGVLGSNFVVQYNTNLADTNWINLLSLTNLSVNPYQFLDPAGIVPPTRFYRAFLLP